MKQLLVRTAAAMISIAVTELAWAQAVPPPGAAPVWPPGAYSSAGQPYPFPAATPRDAYRNQLINRWELERYEGPTPQALQGPSVDGGQNLGR